MVIAIFFPDIIQNFVAPVIGNIGIIVGGIDKTVTSAIDLRKVLAPPKKPAKLAKHIARNRK